MAKKDDRNFLNNDSELWDLFRSDDELAYTRLMTKYSKPLFAYGYRFFRDREFVKDCVQEVFLELWNRRSRISPTLFVKQYLFKAVRVRIFREHRKWNRDKSLYDDYDFIVEFSIESKIIDEYNDVELCQKIQTTMNLLPTRQREILYLRFYEKMPFDHISHIMQISKQSVHNLLQKAYKSFRVEWIVVFVCFSSLSELK